MVYNKLGYVDIVLYALHLPEYIGGDLLNWVLNCKESLHEFSREVHFGESSTFWIKQQILPLY
jgi:hypothetical protein